MGLFQRLIRFFRGEGVPKGTQAAAKGTQVGPPQPARPERQLPARKPTPPFPGDPRLDQVAHGVREATKTPAIYLVPTTGKPTLAGDKLGGFPLLDARGVPQHSDGYLSLLAQIDLAGLPHHLQWLPERGLLQIFVGTDPQFGRQISPLVRLAVKPASIGQKAESRTHELYEEAMAGANFAADGEVSVRPRAGYEYISPSEAGFAKCYVDEYNKVFADQPISGLEELRQYGIYDEVVNTFPLNTAPRLGGRADWCQHEPAQTGTHVLFACGGGQLRTATSVVDLLGANTQRAGAVTVTDTDTFADATWWWAQPDED
ncbi:MAG: DUF1963 domain-containing protein [Winkia neuii]|uniref:DUF1963 domain-containing protein n=1 Tax=Winkia neuii TaxID=33007 RepID=UPI000429B42F|nr:DUF1963 domain-containing protein [Winkia neuii]KWZ74331.1 hypothetical protein HMPREF3198_00889 [Winkia neuii]MDK8098752.1 DUF1963 domain-containing protein [Winkia neuii]MDU3134112.1 DUF1963 domain-containing protein [Winkia neuii]OFJ72253.1 hypothetical protein HMPREF2851_04830 [Actinomyces sp. HMSC064C12]